jgi:hypothetical protein
MARLINHLSSASIFLVLLSNSEVSILAETIQNKTVFSGRNIYSPSLAYDSKKGEYQTWYGGWQANSDYPFDRIYYRTSKDGNSWSGAKTILKPTDLPVAANHVNDPSVIKTINNVTKKNQYTMFYTVCVSPCKTNKDNQIWSSVSEDGMKWLFPKLFIKTNGAAVPSVVAESPRADMWTIYYSNTSQSPNKIFSIQSSGNRDTIGQEKVVYTYPGEGFVANPEVQRIADQWILLFNVYHTKAGAKRLTGDIYAVLSKTGQNWQAGTEQLLVSNDPDGKVCAALSPAILPIGSGQVMMQFAQARYSEKGECDFATFETMQQSILTDEKLTGAVVATVGKSSMEQPSTKPRWGLVALAALSAIVGLTWLGRHMTTLGRSSSTGCEGHRISPSRSDLPHHRS